MQREQLLKYREDISKFSVEENRLRDLHLKALAEGKIQGPFTGFPSLDKMHLKYYQEDAINSEVTLETAYEFMKNLNQKNMNSIAIDYYGNKKTYQELFKNIDAAAASFQKLGVKENDIVTFLMPTLPETIYSIYGLNKLSAVANMVDLRTNAERIKYFINNAKSETVVVFDTVEEKLKLILKETNVKNVISISAVDSLPLLKKLVVNFKNKNKKESSFLKYNEFIELGKEEEITQTSYKQNMPSVIVYTGGTTGIPKGAVITNENMNTMAVQYKATGINIYPSQGFLDIMPPFIAYGLVNGIHLPLCCGLKLILIPKFDPKEFGSLLIKHKPAHFMVVPTHYEFLETDPKLIKKDLSFIESPGMGGDSIVPEKERKTNEFLESHGCKQKIKIGYGMTENSSASTLSISNECYQEGSVGIPLLKNTIGIFDPETGEEKGYNELGEIYITSPTLIKEYLNMPEETSKTIIVKNNQRWIKSGDIGYLTEDGKLFFKGRIKELIIRPDGHNVFPDAIEQVISCHKDVQICSVVGIKSKYNDNGKIPTAYVVLKPKATNLENIIDQIMELQLKNLPERDIALDIRFRKELPLTPIGKIDFQKIEKEEQNLSEVDFQELIGNKNIKKLKK